MIWNNVIIGVYVFALLINGYSWFKYNKNASKEQKKKEGWVSYYRLATIFVLILLFKKMGI